MAKCKHCSAPLPSKSIICEYCGVRNDIELKRKSLGMRLPRSKRSCPDCLIFLDSIDIGKNKRFIIEKCERCFGLFFDNYELQRLLEERLEKSYWLDKHKLHSLLQHPLHKDRIIYRRCPECNKLMQRKNYLNRSGVIMDVCVEHGLWLDAGELKQIQEWTALGGKQNAKKDSLNEKHVHKRAQTKHRRNAHKRKKHYDSSPMETSDALADVMDMVSGVFSLGSRFRF
ncbi:MAG: hypothetical protein COA44_07440 [Arcobacter sp.]|nr:MAG: hypothetical protein COA44_07440 [Arcobacter sp.]